MVSATRVSAPAPAIAASVRPARPPATTRGVPGAACAAIAAPEGTPCGRPGRVPHPQSRGGPPLVPHPHLDAMRSRRALTRTECAGQGGVGLTLRSAGCPAWTSSTGRVQAGRGSMRGLATVVACPPRSDRPASPGWPRGTVKLPGRAVLRTMEWRSIWRRIEHQEMRRSVRPGCAAARTCARAHRAPRWAPAGRSLASARRELPSGCPTAARVAAARTRSAPDPRFSKARGRRRTGSNGAPGAGLQRRCASATTPRTR